MIRIGAGNKRRKRGQDAVRGCRRLRPSVIALEDRALLATLGVGSTADDGSFGTLRWAIGQANGNPGANTIVFSSLFNTPQTITLKAGPLVLTNMATTTITVPGASLLTVNGNKASRVFDIQGGSAAISGLTITGGNADSGGGLLNEGGTLTLTNCAVSGDAATVEGGGIATRSGGTTTLTDCTVSGDTAPDGAGLASSNSTLALINSTLSGNTATVEGGALYSHLGTTTLINCTVSANSAAIGGGLSNSGDSSVDALITLTNTIVAAQKRGADIVSQNGSVTGNFNLIGDGSGISGGTSNLLGTPDQPMNPLLAPLGDYDGPISTMALLPGSPAIGEGAFGPSVPVTDERGAPRGRVVDIGAVQNSLVVESISGSVDTTLANLTLPGAVVLANQFAGAAIRFDPAIFVNSQTIALSAPLVPSNTALSTTITGATSGITISGGNAVRVLQVERGITATLRGLTITGGFTTGDGGGVYNGGTLTMAGCTVSGNSAGSKGGGLGNSSAYSVLTLTDCTVSGNSADNDGGGLFNGGTLTMAGCTVSGNSADNDGGGLYSLEASATLTGCTVSGNSASQGGGLENNTAELSLTASTVSGNTANQGGGVFTNNGLTTLTNAIVSANSAGSGGGLYTLSDGVLVLTDCTVSGNVADNDGGGLLNGYLGTTELTNATVSGNSAKAGGGLYVSATSGGTTVLTNTIVAGQAGGADIEVKSGTVTGNNNLIGDGSGISGGTDNLLGTPSHPIDPLLAALGDYRGPTFTMALLPGSPAISKAGAVTALSSSGVPDTSSTSIPVANGTIIAASSLPTLTSGSYFAIQIGSEQMAVVGLTMNAYGTRLDVVRGVNGTTAAAHLGGASVFLASDQRGYTGGSTVAADIGAFQSQGFTLTPVDGSTPQSTAAGAAFRTPLAVTVTANNPVEPVDGGVVTFAVTPFDGASATFSAATATIAGGVAIVTATANTTSGTYDVDATATGAGPASFVLTNAGVPSLTVTTRLDVVDAVDGLTSLREAIAYANSHPGPDTIIFDPASFATGRRTIRLTGGPLVLTDPATTTILGPGANRLTLSGGGKSRVFDIEGGSLAIQGLTIADGRADRGGGLRNDRGTLSLSQVTIRGNRARAGGGLFNNGTTTLTDVVLRGNTARVGSGLFSTRKATLTRRSLARPASTGRIVFENFNGTGGVPTHWKQFEGQPGDVVEKRHSLTVTDSTGNSAGIASTAKTVPFNAVGVTTTNVARINSINSNGNAIFGLIGENAQDSPAGYLAVGIDAHGNVFIASSIAPTLKPTSKPIGVVKGYSGKSITLTFTINSMGVKVDGGGFKSGLIPFADLSNFSLAAAFPDGNARPAVGAASQPGQNGGSASFGSIQVSTAPGARRSRSKE